MMMHPLTWTAFFLSAVGAINWGLTIFFKFDLVEYICNMVKINTLQQLLYGLIALSGFYALVSLFM